MNTNPKSMKDAPGEELPAAFAAMFHEGVEKAVELQKGMLDMVVQQSALVVEASRYLSASAGIVLQAAGRAAETQKAVLEFAALQNKTLAEAVKRQAGIGAGTPAAIAADAIQRGVDTAIEAQKEILDAASKPLKAAAAKA